MCTGLRARCLNFLICHLSIYSTSGQRIGLGHSIAKLLLVVGSYVQDRAKILRRFLKDQLMMASLSVSGVNAQLSPFQLCHSSLGPWTCNHSTHLEFPDIDLEEVLSEDCGDTFDEPSQCVQVSKLKKNRSSMNLRSDTLTSVPIPCDLLLS